MRPSTPEENLERLADAGEVVPRGIPKCQNCERRLAIFRRAALKRSRFLRLSRPSNATTAIRRATAFEIVC